MTMVNSGLKGLTHRHLLSFSFNLRYELLQLFPTEVEFTSGPTELFALFFIHSKLELLTQFKDSDDEKY